MGRIISFGVGGYRSFGNDVAHFPRVSKINLIAGSNNSGKSNVLRFVHEHYATAVNGTKAGRTKWGFGNLDAHQGTAPFHFALGLPLGSEGHDAIKEHEGVRRALRRRTEEVIDTLLDCQCLTDGGDVAWFRFSSPRLGDDLQAVVPKDFESCIDSNIWLRLAQALTGQRTDSPTNAARDVFKILAPNKDASVNVALVPAIRQVTAGETADFSGSGIIDRLARLQNPGVQEQNHRKQFGKINGFLQWVLADDNATIEIPYERDTILVHHGGRTLPCLTLVLGYTRW